MTDWKYNFVCQEVWSHFSKQTKRNQSFNDKAWQYQQLIKQIPTKLVFGRKLLSILISIYFQKHFWLRQQQVHSFFDQATMRRIFFTIHQKARHLALCCWFARFLFFCYFINGGSLNLCVVSFVSFLVSCFCSEIKLQFMVMSRLRWVIDLLACINKLKKIHSCFLSFSKLAFLILKDTTITSNQYLLNSFQFFTFQNATLFESDLF